MLGRYKTVFSDAQDKELVQHLIHLEERLFGITLSDLRTLAFEFSAPHYLKKHLSPIVRALRNNGALAAVECGRKGRAEKFLYASQMGLASGGLEF
ncbi:hypothetical protein AVEN_210983-1 [Araneus ventricosus]|uniref:Uncharacterized protein n=1 Tax=Araneus ventricosus TaxID=182803 RepID=A0A4Y2QVI3_ARAVE|nr:hypothetical protein AVEN_210983-1 [Araneus ventricosus]